MSLITIRQFRRLMRQSVQVQQLLSYDTDGSKIYGAPTTYTAAVVGQGKLTLGAQGQQVVSRQQVYIMGAPAIRPEDKVILSTGDVGSTESGAISPPIMSVERYPFLAGQFCTVLNL